MALILDGTGGIFNVTWSNTTQPASPVIGQQGYNTDINAVETWDGSTWVTGGSGGGSAAYTRTSFTATASQTTFTVSYTPGYIEVFLSGVLLGTADYTATNGTTIVLAVGATAGDLVDCIAYNTTTGIGPGLADNNTWTGTNTFDDVTFGGTITANASVGTAGQVLQSTGTGVEWATASSFNPYAPGPIGNATASTGDFTDLSISGTLTANASVGTMGQLLTSQGAGNVPTWTSASAISGLAPIETFADFTFVDDTFSGLTNLTVKSVFKLTSTKELILYAGTGPFSVYAVIFDVTTSTFGTPSLVSVVSSTTGMSAFVVDSTKVIVTYLSASNTVSVRALTISGNSITSVGAEYGALASSTVAPTVFQMGSTYVLRHATSGTLISHTPFTESAGVITFGTGASLSCTAVNSTSTLVYDATRVIVSLISTVGTIQYTMLILSGGNLSSGGTVTSSATGGIDGIFPYMFKVSSGRIIHASSATNVFVKGYVISVDTGTNTLSLSEVIVNGAICNTARFVSDSAANTVMFGSPNTGSINGTVFVLGDVAGTATTGITQAIGPTTNYPPPASWKNSIYGFFAGRGYKYERSGLDVIVTGLSGTLPFTTAASLPTVGASLVGNTYAISPSVVTIIGVWTENGPVNSTGAYAASSVVTETNKTSLEPIPTSVGWYIPTAVLDGVYNCYRIVVK